MSIAGVRAVAFDLDDTLTDWWTGIERAATIVGEPAILERVRAEMWVERDGIVVDRHHWRIRREAPAIMAPALVEPFLGALDPPLFDDAVPVLDALRGRVALALLTNNPQGADVVDRHGLRDAFDCVIVAEPEERKPDPRAFAPLLEHLDLGSDEIAYVGDSVTDDVEGALGVGIHAVWLNRWNDPWPLPSGVVSIASLAELHDRC
jgi:HAD superfamily hydrolase (TIGR01549 family)